MKRRGDQRRRPLVVLHHPMAARRSTTSTAITQPVIDLMPAPAPPVPPGVARSNAAMSAGSTVFLPWSSARTPGTVTPRGMFETVVTTPGAEEVHKS